jgi:hypothetical protein
MGGQGASDFGFGDASQALAGRSARRDRGEAPLQVAVLLEMASHPGRDGESIVGIEVAAADKVVGQGAGLVARPGLEGGHELDLVDQAVLQREQAEEQAALEDVALSSEPPVALRGSVRRHRRAQGGSPLLRSVDPTEARRRGWNRDKLAHQARVKARSREDRGLTPPARPEPDFGNRLSMTRPDA